MNSKDRNTGPGNARDFGVRGLDSEIIKRLKEAIRDAGGNKAVSERSGIPLSTLNDALAGNTDIRSSNLVALARAVGKSLDWIMLGEARTAPHAGFAEPPAGYGSLRQELLEECIQLVEDWLVENRRTMTPDKKAQVLAYIYETVAESARLGHSRPDKASVHQILRLVA
jgi:hypothetical protein